MEKYLTIYHDLVEKTMAKYWADAEMLPSENSLGEMYEVSRETIRKALNLLAQDGYIQKVRGKGSVIIHQNKFDFPVSGIVSFKELAETLKMQTNTIVNELSIVEVDSKIQFMLDIKVNEPVWKVVRTREIAGEKVILDKDYFSTALIPILTKEICEDSIYAYLENELQHKISYARKEITVEEPTDEDRQLLDLVDHSNVVVIKSKVYLEDTRLFQYTESRHRPDKFQFVDFARRIRN